MRKASLLVLLVLLLAGAPALAQDANDTTTNDTAGTGNDTATGDAAGNETAGGDAPAAPEPVTLLLEGHGEGGRFYFKGEDGARNPRITVAPGAQVTVTLRTVSGGVHNFCTDATGEKVCTKIVGEGAEDTVTFTAPESGTFEYWCDPHRGSGMKGTLAVAAASTPRAPADGEWEQFNGPTVDLGDLGHSDCADKPVPAATAEGAVGGPTVADYLEMCRKGPDAGATVRATHVADYFIPGSWVLIGLGIVAAVWVHRKYKP